MEMDVNRQTRHNANLMTISARCCANNNATTETIAATTTTTPTSPVASGCCGILSRLFCVSRHKATQSVAGTECSHSESLFMQRKALTTQPAVQRRRRTPQEIYFESRGKSCKKLLKFNGNSNKSSRKATLANGNGGPCKFDGLTEGSRSQSTRIQIC
ncbi:uncharacterized protein Dvir_GJ20744, isoform B [Drosophila virilis]|uniref:Uncharacterized protein, isoform B n=1 Tax=Drosophila virilis TaxID=7244 RepID=A0A0Q9WGD1_DROVI|nr:uncharacterized protein Dvir_GJ20744, isoform B [Drosophila virilis]